MVARSTVWAAQRKASKGAPVGRPYQHYAGVLAQCDVASRQRRLMAWLSSFGRAQHAQYEIWKQFGS